MVYVKRIVVFCIFCVIFCIFCVIFVLVILVNVVIFGIKINIYGNDDENEYFFEYGDCDVMEG